MPNSHYILQGVTEVAIFLAQDNDGKALIAYSSERNKVMHVARLTKNFTDVDIAYARTMVSPCIVVQPIASKRHVTDLASKMERTRGYARRSFPYMP